MGRYLSKVLVLTVLACPVLGWLLARCDISCGYPPCNTKIFDPATNTPCMDAFPEGTLCIERDAAHCTSNPGKVVGDGSTSWAQGCKAGGTLSDHCVTHGRNCAKKYECVAITEEPVLIACIEASVYLIDGEEQWFQVLEAVSPTCIPGG